VRRAEVITLTPVEQSELEALVARPGPPERPEMRARIVLEAARGRTNAEIAQDLEVHRETVARWRHRFAVNRTEGLRREAPRPRRPREGTPEIVDRIRWMTLETSPSDRDRWTTRGLARVFNVSHMYVHRVWKAYGLSPSSSAMKRPVPVGRPWVDVVGIYVDAPAAALVFAVDFRDVTSDEPLSHARTDPEGPGAFLSSNFHAPAALAAALSRAEELLPRLATLRRSPNELLVFLRNLDDSTPEEAELHVVFDRPLEYLSSRVRSWLESHPRFHVKTAPADGLWTATADEWMRAFHDLTLHRDSFVGVTALTEALERAAGAGLPVRGRFSWTLISRSRSGLGARTPGSVRRATPSIGEVPAVSSRSSEGRAYRAE
jgi:transposase